MTIVNEQGSLSDLYRNYIAVSRYARWKEAEGRRETWTETVDRYVDFMKSHLVKNHDYNADAPIFNEVRSAILNHEVMPSMRALMTAGPALARENVAGYNCAFLAVDHPRAFDEALYVLMNGTGVGFSVEEKHVSQLPVISETFYPTGTMIVVEDSKLGWAKAYKELISLLYGGQVPRWDLSKVRPAGSRLKTFGGRASGPGPLDSLFEFTVQTFQDAAGRRLRPIEAHDIMCKIGDVVVVGGVRRSALISLSDLDDQEMAKAKFGAWYDTAGYRRLANNSAVYNETPSIGQFLDEWTNLYESKSGERGIFNISAVREHVASFGRRDATKIAGLNPCAEIVLRSNQFCNLTEVIISAEDTEATLRNKIRIASILGTWQATLTNFKYLRRVWRDNCEDERLLGVSLTGIFGNRLTGALTDDLGPFLDRMREAAVSTNKYEATLLGIKPATAVTTVKPSGTVSQLAGVSSGIHPWYDHYYIRSIRGDVKDPLAAFMKDSGIPCEPDVMAPETTLVFGFPIMAPDNAVVTSDLTAIEHLELWKVYREHWTEHNPSVTINVQEHEWVEVAAWVYKNFDSIGGVSFLPASEHSYKQAPYQSISAEAYFDLASKMPKEIDWSMLSFYETSDGTSGSQELACSSGSCDVADIRSADLTSVG